MAYNEKTAQRLRQLLADQPQLAERRMMGALCFMVRDRMVCGVMGDDVFIRVGRDDRAAALAQPHAHAVVLGKRTMQGFVGVAPAGVRTAALLQKWLQRALQTAHPETPAPPRRPRARKA